MCGVVFLYKEDYEAAQLTERARRALTALAHRGPDDEGLESLDSGVIGHRRLSIIDLQASKQPMQDYSKRYVLSFNGEIYNYQELKQSLEPKWQFKTQGDTEVLLAGLILHGPQFLARAEGMWALVLWDRQEKKLLLARDRVGKKPLYYRMQNQSIACASELRALKCLDDKPWQEDEDSTADFLRYGFYLPGHSAYQDVKEVLPGHYCEWSPGAELISTSYWSLEPGSFNQSYQAACSQLNDVLVEAVRKRMIADVEVGAFLSGGVDSSLIVSLLVNKMGVTPKTFTIGFQSETYDERKHARIIAEQCGTQHYEKCIDQCDVEALSKLIFDHVGQPFADASLLPTALVSELAAEHVKVVLSGDGSDELFSGYQRYQARLLMRWFTRLPSPLRRNVKQLVRALPEPMVHHSHSLIKKAHLFLDAGNRYESERPYVAPVMLSHGDMRVLMPDLGDRGQIPPGLSGETTLDDVKRMMAKDVLVYLPQDIMLKVDRASMAYSLEARAPFLDSQLIQTAFSMPRRWHRRRFSGKRMLKSAFSDYLPESIWNRRKQGFGVPLNQWFQGKLGDELQQLIQQSSSMINGQFVSQLLAEHRSNHRDRGMVLWTIYIYLLWRTQSDMLVS